MNIVHIFEVVLCTAVAITLIAHYVRKFEKANFDEGYQKGAIDTWVKVAKMEEGPIKFPETLEWSEDYAKSFKEATANQKNNWQPISNSYTQKEVIEIIQTLLASPDQLDDAIHNENTEWDAESLLELALLEGVRVEQTKEMIGVVFNNINQPT